MLYISKLLQFRILPIEIEMVEIVHYQTEQIDSFTPCDPKKQSLELDPLEERVV